MFTNKRILIIDDSVTFLIYMRSLFLREDALVETATSGRSGLEKFESGPAYDMILLDLVLPDMNGIEVLEEIRKIDERIPIVMLTGKGDIKSALAAVRAGADGYSEKQDVEGNAKTEAFFLTLEQAIQYRAGVIAQKEMQEKLQFMSMHDALTGLYNRAYFEEELARLDKSRRFPISLIIVDVNWLKHTNDVLGHYAGDELLQLTAKVLRKTFRAEDIIARIGGDEFAVLLLDMDALNAEQALSRVQDILSEENASRNGARLSLALGSATATEVGGLIPALKQADTAMYRNKEDRKTGRLA